MFRIDVVEGAAEHPGEAVDLAGELVRGCIRRQRGRIGVLERVEGMAQRPDVDAARTELPRDRVAERLGQAFHEVVGREVRCGSQDGVPHGAVLERGDDRHAVAERLVERTDLDERDVEEVRPDGVEEGMTLFMGHDVHALR